MNSCQKINTLEIILPHAVWNSDHVGLQCFHSGTGFNMVLWIRFFVPHKIRDTEESSMAHGFIDSRNDYFRSGA
jgi:hypothetical protein